MLDFLDRLLERLRHQPFVLVATARPDLAIRMADRNGRHNAITLHLDPLAPAAAGELVNKPLGHEPPPEVRDLLIERSGGNPLFLEELVALLKESGVLADDDESVRSSPVELPAILRGLVSARLDALPAGDPALLDDAAVAGRSAAVELLYAAAGLRAEPDPIATLDRLVADDLLTVADGTLSFKSDVVREVAYSTLTKAERARRHAGLGDWLSDAAGAAGRLDEAAESIAHHLAAAAELARELGSIAGVPHDINERVVIALERATDRATLLDTPHVALSAIERAIELFGAGSGGPVGRRLISRGHVRTASFAALTPTGRTPAIVWDLPDAESDALSFADWRLAARAESVWLERNSNQRTNARGRATIR